MFSSIKNFLYRHRKKCIVTGLVIGGSILISRYAHKRIIEWQDKEVKEFLERTRKQYQFENTERTCNQTILSLSVQLKNEISKCLDTEALLCKLRSKQGDAKLQIWEDLKILSFAKHASLIYCGVMLTIALRVQVNVLGGYLINDPSDDSSFQENYLSLCQHFINTGVRDVCKLMETHMRIILQEFSLKSTLSLGDLERLFWLLQANVTEDRLDPLGNLSLYLFNNSHDAPYNQDSVIMKSFFDETVKLLSSDNVVSLAQSSVSRAFSNSIDDLAEYFVLKRNCDKQIETGKNGSKHSGTFIHPNTIKMPVAKIIPLIHGLTNMKGKTESEPWIYQFIIMDKIKTLGGDVFNKFSVV